MNANTKISQFVPLFYLFFSLRLVGAQKRKRYIGGDSAATQILIS